MSIYRRPDSLFWWMSLEGTALRESTRIPLDGGTPNQTQDNRRLAQAVYAARMGDLARRRHRLPLAVEHRTFADHREWYATNVTPHKRGHVRERSILRQLGRFFDVYDLDAIDVTLVREWRTWRLKAVKPTCVDREEHVLKPVLGSAVPKYLEHHPLDGLPGLRLTWPDTRILSDDEETRLLTALENTEQKGLVLCALDTLLRLSNARALTRKQDHQTYVFSHTKTGAIKIPVSTRLRTALDALPMTGGFYFPTYAIGSNTPASRMFQDACARADVPHGRQIGGVTFHSLRHTGASRMLAAGHDVETVRRIGGWKNLKVLQRYLHPTDDAARAAVNSIARTSASR